MSTEIKNTLFRFVTTRTPELLEQDQVENSFVTYPTLGLELDPITNVFLEATKNLPANKTKAKALSDAASAFAENAIIKREELFRGYVSKNFYDFAVWLTSNRSKLTVANVAAKLNPINDPLVRVIPILPIEDETIINSLWENLFYQIVTYKSGYVREGILSVLIADFFIKRYRSSVNLTDADLRKLAQARVIIPKILFEKEDVTAKKEQLKDVLKALPLNTKELDREMEQLICKESIMSYQAIIEELKMANDTYQKKYQEEYDAARKKHDDALAIAYKSSETVKTKYIEKETGKEKTFIDYVNIIVPEFKFEKQPELGNDSLTGRVSETNKVLIQELANTYNYQTYTEVINHYQNQINLGTQALFEDNNLTETQVSTGGVILPTTNTAPAVNVFSLNGVYNGIPIPLTLLLSGDSSSADVVAATYKITFDDDTEVSGTSFTDAIVNNKLSLKLFLEGLDLEGHTTGELEATVTLSDGKKIQLIGNVAKTKSPFSVGSHVFVDGNTDTYLVKGKGTYQLKLIELDPDESGPSGSEGSENNPTDGSSINYIPSGFGIKRLGIADYRKVEQEVCCYVPGEVSHIENVMASEYKEKATRRLRRTENTTTSSTEKEIEKLTDTTSTDRFEMNQEVNSVLNEETSIGVNANVRYKGSLIEASLGADFAHSSSSEESNNQAVTRAKEITEKALDRVVQKIKEERISKIIEEFEENNKHGYDNRKNNQHVSGVYRWVDKIYRNKVINYGKRLMYEFMIPQPASMHNLAIEEKKGASGMESIIKPVDPRKATGNTKLATHKDLTEANYSHWASAYNADVDGPPAFEIHMGKTYSKSQQGGDGGNDTNKSVSDLVDIPEGYKMVDYTTEMSKGGNGGLIRVNVQRKEYVKKIPVSVLFEWLWVGNVSISFKLQRTKEFFEQWQIETFNAIIKAYEEQLAEYNSKVAELRVSQSEKAKTNPMFYRQIENTVLRKNCIEYLATNDLLGRQSLLLGIGLTGSHVDKDNAALETYSAKVKFFEQAFEWDLMSYYFYPFYWAPKNEWAEKYNVTETDDPIFRAFLQSGMARVILTIRPGFEEAVNWYMATGQIWNGGQVPTMDDPLFVSIVEELREPEGEVEETWESRVPTSLSIIQAGSIGLEVVQALPCDDDCADYKLFDSDGMPVLDQNGKPVSTNPFKKFEDVKLQGMDNTEETQQPEEQPEEEPEEQPTEPGNSKG